MPNILTVSKAARLVGTTRGALQKKILSGELSAFEGKISVNDLLQVYPDTKIENTTMLEKVERIKAKAVRRRKLSENASLDTEIIATRLTTLNKELTSVKSKLDKYSDLLKTVTQKLTDIENLDDAHLRSNVAVVQNWLKKEMQGEMINSMAHLLVNNVLHRLKPARVKVLPSGHEFFIEGNESILEAALHAGIALNYGCTNGNCGSCKARLVSGEVQKIRHYDYVISEAEKNMGYRLICSYTPVTDITIEAIEAQSVADIPLQQINTKVKKLDYVTDNLLVLRLQTPRTKTLRFFSGQFVTITLKNKVSADYFLASCPCDGRNLEFHLYKTSNDRFTEIVFNCLKRGHVVNIEGPKGDFVWQEESTRPTLFIAYAHGFAPIKSLIEHANALNKTPSYHLYWIVPNKDEHYQSNQCRAWADGLENFQYTLLVANLSFQHALAQVLKDYPNLNDFEVYLSGFESFISVAKTLLQQHHLPETQLHVGYLF